METEEEALAIALSYLPEGVDEYTVYDPQCGYKKIFYWEPHPTEPEAWAPYPGGLVKKLEPGLEQIDLHSEFSLW